MKENTEQNLVEKGINKLAGVNKSKITGSFGRCVHNVSDAFCLKSP